MAKVRNDPPSKDGEGKDKFNYGGVEPHRVPKTIDRNHEKVDGGGSPGSYRQEKQSKPTGKK